MLLSTPDTSSETLAILDLEYLRLEGVRAEFLRRLDDVERQKRQINIRRAAYAPVYSVPDDVLYQILEEAYAHDLHRCRLDYNSHTPLAIAQVSRRWRHAALSLPRIWSCIHVPAPLSRSHIPRIALYVARSLPMPISFTIRCRFYTPASPEMSLFMECLSLLLATRVRSCTLYTDYASSMETLTGFLSAAHRCEFEHLHLQLLGEDSRLVMDGSCVPPYLRSLVLHAVRLPSPPIALSNLRRLTLEQQPISLHYLHEIALSCPALTHLTLREVTTAADGTLVEARFAALEHLYLSELHLSRMGDLLAWIDAPQLAGLAIRDISLGGTHPHALPAPRVRAYAALRHMRIHFPYAAAHIPALVAQTPAVAALDLTGTNVGPLARALLAAPGAALLPALEVLTATILWNERHDIFLDLVRHRERIGRPLKEIRLGYFFLAELDGELLHALSQHVTVTRLDERNRVR